VNNAYRDEVESVGLHISGTSPDGTLVEFVEYDRSIHPFLVATQAHPEYKSRPTQPHPLFHQLVVEALRYHQDKEGVTASDSPVSPAGETTDIAPDVAE